MILPQSHRATQKEGQGGKEKGGRGGKNRLVPLFPCLLVHFSISAALSLNHLAFLGLALCASLSLSGCHKTIEIPPDIVFEHKITPDPPKTGSATITLKLADSAGKPINGARINLEGNMSHPGMRPVFSEAREVGSGLYEAALEFTMRGDWFILFHITLPDGQKLQRQIDVKGVQSG
jgi:hypothetical protein